MKKDLFFVALSLLFTACSPLPTAQDYENRGQPASLLSVSAERVAFTVNDQATFDSLVSWIEEDIPTRAELHCPQSAGYCKDIKQFLAKATVPSEENTSLATGAVTLIYERLVTHNCNHHFISNHINTYNLNHPAFGCSTATNQVHMAHDHRDFVRPPHIGPQDAEKAVLQYKKYLANDGEQPY